MKAYMVYIVLTAIALYMNGEYGEYDFTKIFLARFLNCIVTFYAFEHFVNTPERLKKTITFLVVVLLCNCVVTILQYIGNPIGRAIALLLITSTEVQEDIQAGQNFNASTMFGKDITIGIFNFTFINGNYIAIVGLMLAGMWAYCKNLFHKGILLSLLFIFIIACLASQSRTPFILFIMFLLFFLVKKHKSKLLIVALALFSVLLIVLMLPYLLDSETFGRIFSTEKYENDPRQKIWEWCIPFIIDHLLWGGPISYEKTYEMAPHNYFLNAFITSGLFGGLVAVYLFIKMLFDSLTLLIKKHILMVTALSASTLVYIAGSLFHNASAISGDTMFFIVYCLMLKAKSMEPSLSKK